MDLKVLTVRYIAEGKGAFILECDPDRPETAGGHRAAVFLVNIFNKYHFSVVSLMKTVVLGIRGG